MIIGTRKKGWKIFYLCLWLKNIPNKLTTGIPSLYKYALVTSENIPLDLGRIK